MPTTTNGDVEIYYETFGSDSDPVLLLVNGLGSQCINYADAWCEKFAAHGFRVARFDNRDTGLSSKLEGATYTLTDMADDAFAVLDAIAAERAHVIGLSMGGMIVQRMAIEHPERLLSLTSVMSRTGEPEYGRELTRGTRLPPGEARAVTRRVRRRTGSRHCASTAPSPSGSTTVGRARRPRGVRPLLLPRGRRTPDDGDHGRRVPRRRAAARSASRRSSCTEAATRSSIRPVVAAPPRSSRARAMSRSRAWATTTRRSSGTPGSTRGWTSSTRRASDIWRRVVRVPADPSPRDASCARLCQAATNGRQTPRDGDAAAGSAPERVAVRARAGVAKKGRTYVSIRSSTTGAHSGSATTFSSSCGIGGEVEQLARRQTRLRRRRACSCRSRRTRSPSSR